jgi:hypothetical protein
MKFIIVLVALFAVGQSQYVANVVSPWTNGWTNTWSTNAHIVNNGHYVPSLMASHAAPLTIPTARVATYTNWPSSTAWTSPYVAAHTPMVAPVMSYMNGMTASMVATPMTYIRK